MNIRTSLVMLVLLALAPAVLIQGLNEIELRRSREAEVEANALRLAQFADGEFDRVLEGVRIALASLAESPGVRGRDEAGCAAFARGVQRAAPHLAALGAIGLDGRLFCSAGLDGPEDAAIAGLARRAAEGKRMLIGEYATGGLARVPVLPVAAPFFDRQGVVAGAVFALISLDWVARYLEGRGLGHDTGSLLISDRYATILVRVPDHARWVGQKLGPPYLEEVYAETPGSKEITGLDGVRRILGYLPVAASPEGLYVGVALTKQTAFASIDAASERGLVLIVLGTALAMALAWLFGRYFIVRPVERLNRAVHRWSLGEPGVRTHMTGGSELAGLGRTFDAMASRIETATQRLEERVREETAARVKGEEKLRHAEKMETLGRLAGGIAHDFNNLLHVILGSLERLRQRTVRHADALDSQRDARLGLQAAERAAALVKRMLAFARRQALEPRPIDPNGMILEMSELLGRTLGEAIEVRSVPGEGVWPVLADRSQAETSLMNLALNARDAMPDGGQLTLEAANCYLDEAYAAAIGDIAPGQYVEFSVSDTGTGMTADVAARAFEPFFTTKQPGLGTGLGLSQVYGFAQQSNGHVRIFSEPARGTTVKLYLPRSHEPIRVEPVVVPLPVPRGSQQLVLVVEDEPGVLEYSQQMLEEAGYATLGAGDGAAALAILERHPEIALLFTDVGLPGGMTGRELADEALRRRPELKVLYATGYERSALVHDGRLDPGVELLLKPFSAGELVRRVGRLIGATRSRRYHLSPGAVR